VARAHFVQKARKDNKEEGIKKGDSYYWWKFRYGGKCYSKTPPKASQLTQSAHLGLIFGIQERLEALSSETPWDDVKGEVESAIEELRQEAEECDEKRNNMPEALQDSETGDLLEQRRESCETASDELEGIDLEVAEPEERESALEEIQGVNIEAN
jgi:hypothetical protein